MRPYRMTPRGDVDMLRPSSRWCWRPRWAVSYLCAALAVPDALSERPLCACIFTRY